MDVSSVVAAQRQQTAEQTSLLMIKQNSDADQSMVQLLTQSPALSTPPPGCGTQVDILA
jgi:hypothetical protein